MSMTPIIRKAFVVSVLSASMLIAIPAFAHDGEIHVAQTDAGTTSATTNVRPTKEELQERRDAIEAERKARLLEIQTNRDQIKTDRTQNAEELKTRVTEERALRTMERAERAKEFIKRVIARVQNMADKMESFIPRIEERLQTLADRGVDVSEAQNNLRDAQIAIDNAQSTIATLTDLQDELGSEDTDKSSAIASVREVITEAHDYLKEARTHLVAAIRSIKSPNAQANRDDTDSDAHGEDTDNDTDDSSDQ